MSELTIQDIEKEAEILILRKRIQAVPEERKEEERLIKTVLSETTPKLKFKGRLSGWRKKRVSELVQKARSGIALTWPERRFLEFCGVDLTIYTSPTTNPPIV